MSVRPLDGKGVYKKYVRTSFGRKGNTGNTGAGKWEYEDFRIARISSKHQRVNVLKLLFIRKLMYIIFSVSLFSKTTLI